MLILKFLQRSGLQKAPKLKLPSICSASYASRNLPQQVEDDQRKSILGIHTNSNILKVNVLNIGVRTKYTKHSSNKDDNSDSEDENDGEFKDERDSKVVKTKVNSLRADLLLKAGLGMARNKIEVVFYESKIRVNGKKLPKKSSQLQVGDEIDVIKSFSNANPSHLVIGRVIILSATEKDDGLGVHLRRYKSMLVENYKGVNAYKSSDS